MKSIDHCIGGETLAKKLTHSQRFNSLGVLFHKAGRMKEAISCYKIALLKEPKSPIPSFNLGNLLRDIGKYPEAVKFYKHAISLKPDFIDAYFNLSLIYRQLNDRDEALSLYRKILDLDPGNDTAIHFISALEGEVPDSVSPDYVKGVFEQYAKYFDEHLVNTLGYQTPSYLREMLINYRDDPRFKYGIDLGCGTGLSGEVFAGFCDHFLGIDLSGEMLKKSREKSVYTEVKKIEIVSYLSESKMSFDFILGVDVLPYISKLETFFSLLDKNTHSGSIVLLSTEDISESDIMLTLRLTGRIGHSHKYIEGCALANNFEIKSFQRRNIRSQDKESIVGGLYLLAKL